jgi:hypothetical protein
MTFLIESVPQRQIVDLLAQQSRIISSCNFWLIVLLVAIYQDLSFLLMDVDCFLYVAPAIIDFSGVQSDSSPSSLKVCS